MKFLSCFSGVECASVAWLPIGWKCVGVAEIEPFPCAVLNHHHPAVPNLGDVLADDFLDRAIATKAQAVVGGPPCQDFSVAGLRAGLAGARGNLSLRWAQVIDAVRPVFSVTENVPGWLSVNDGHAFGAFLATLVGCNTAIVPPGNCGGRWTDAGMVDGPSGRAAWRILDAQYFALAQRRRRLFVVGSSDPRVDPSQVLLIEQGVRRHHPPSRQTGERVAPTIAARTKGGGGLGTDHDLDGGLIADNVATLDASYGRLQGGSGQDMNHGHSHLVPLGLGEDGELARALNGCLTASGRHDASVDTFIGVAQAFKPSHFTRGKDGAPDDIVLPLFVDADKGDQDTLVHAFDARQSDVIQYGDWTGPLDTDGHTMGILAFSTKDHGADAGPLAPTLRAGGFDKSHANGGVMPAVAIPFDTTQITSRENRSNPQSGDPCHTLAKDANAPTVAFNITPSNSNKDYNARQSDRAQALSGASGGTPSARGGDVIVQSWAVRRLMPVECERLQGLPDGYTLVPYRGKPASDSVRYRAIGNGIAVPVLKWLGLRIQKHLDDIAD